MGGLRAFCVLACCALSVLPTAVHRPRADGGPSIVARERAGGLELSLSAPRGPFFLSELLPVTVALHNQSGAAVGYFGAFTPTLCGSAVDVLVAGSPPLYTPPRAILPSCPAPRPIPGGLAPGRAVSVRLLVPVTASGRVTVAVHMLFVTATHREGAGVWYSSGPGPFAARWPTLAIDVAPRVPADRAIRLRPSGASLHIVAPPPARSSLLYQEVSVCGNEGSGDADWQPLGAGTIAPPRCAGQGRWSVLVSAPGFAIASATQQGEAP